MFYILLFFFFKTGGGGFVIFTAFLLTFLTSLWCFCFSIGEIGGFYCYGVFFLLTFLDLFRLETWEFSPF